MHCIQAGGRVDYMFFLMPRGLGMSRPSGQRQHHCIVGPEGQLGSAGLQAAVKDTVKDTEKF